MPGPPRRAVSLGLVLASLAMGCAGGGGGVGTDDATLLGEEPEVGGAESNEGRSVDAPVGTATPESALPIDQVEVGQCLPVGWGTPGGAWTAAVSCDQPHGHEVYASGTLSAGSNEPYPGVRTVEQWALAEVCDPRFAEFAGEPPGRVPLRRATTFPDEHAWMSGDRTVVCTVVPAVDAATKIGTARGGSLDSDESVVMRAVVDGRTELVLASEYGIPLSLTRGAFALPPSSPEVMATGLLFGVDDAPGSEAEAPHFVLLDFDESGSIGSVGIDDLVGWQIQDPRFTVGEPSIVFAAREDGEADWDLYRLIDGDELVRLTAGPGDERWPRVLPDEQGIVYNADGSIWVMEIDGENQRRVTDGAGLDHEPAVSPDGGRIVFTSARSGDDDVWAVNVDGTALQNLTSHPADDSFPFFSGDGSLIYFQTDRLGVDANLMMMRTDGSEPSYFGTELGANGAVISDDAAARLAASTIPIPPRGRYSVIEGPAGSLQPFSHSSGRVTVSLPVGWQVTEVGSGHAAELVAAPDIDAFFERWDATGVVVRVVDADGDDWRTLVAMAEASTCPLVVTGAPDQSLPERGGLESATAVHDCGGATARVRTVYDSTTSTGLVVEDQRTGDASAAATERLLDTIHSSVVWN